MLHTGLQYSFKEKLTTKEQEKVLIYIIQKLTLFICEMPHACVVIIN